MTSRVAEESRLKPVRAPWRFGWDWLNGRAFAGLAGFSIAVLFGALWWMLRDTPMPRRRMDFPPPPQLLAQIAGAQDRLQANPQDIAALVELGTLLFDKGSDSYVESIGALEEARDLGALDPRIFYCLGIMYQEEGLFPFALTEYKRFLRHYPEDREVRLLAAKLYYRLGMFPEALSEYERLKFLDPQDPIVEENMGLSLWGAKNMDRALASFGQLKTYGGDFARRAEFYLGQIALEAGKYQDAADHFALCGAVNAELSGIALQRVHTGLATAFQKLGRWEEAKASWEIVLKADPKDPKAPSALREAARRAAAAKKTAVKKK
ncbi:MAG: tetratricopeptide repeat protein [Elusimicrobiota bacterium]